MLADEPTGNLDTENEENVVELLGSLAHDLDFTVILVTHNREIAERADVRMVMKDGRLTVKRGLLGGEDDILLQHKTDEKKPAQKHSLFPAHRSVCLFPGVGRLILVYGER